MKMAGIIVAATALTLASGGVSLAQRVGSDSLGANWRPQQDDVRADVRSGQAIPLSQAIEIVGRQVPGRLLNAGKEGSTYRIRWAAEDGRRIDFIVDARTGRILSGG